MNATKAPATPGGWPERRVAGVALHFTSLPGPHGIGDVGDTAQQFVERCGAANLGVWQVLPIGPTAFGDSPYQALSDFAGNEMLIGLEPLVRDGLLRSGELEPLRALPGETVDFGALIPVKQVLLRRAAQRFLAAGPPPGFESFVTAHGDAWLDDYALYRVIKTSCDERPWTEWPPRLARRDPAALQQTRERHADAILRIKALQYLFERQWVALREHAARNGVRIVGDMPFYIALDSADAWAGRELISTDSAGLPRGVAGVPPDYFSEDGQLWGNPLYDWNHHARTGYRWWVTRLAHAARRFDLVRVDHFRGFESYWAVPPGAQTAREGEWRAGPGDALFDAASAALGELPLVAEDLGIITEAVTLLRRRHGIPGMKVLQFEVANPDFDPAAVEEDCVCYTATHDNDTTAGWFAGSVHDHGAAKSLSGARERALHLTGGAAETIHLDMIRLAFSTPARVAIAPLADYLGLGSEARFNVPGTPDGNWRWRLREEQWTASLESRIRELVEADGR